MLDAPVSGGGPAAAQGSLLVMVGGDEAGLVRARPVLTTFGDPILHLGGVGAGQTAKLVNNLVFTAQIALSLEAFALADGLGLDTEAMAHVLERGSGASRATAMLSALGLRPRWPGPRRRAAAAQRRGPHHGRGTATADGGAGSVLTLAELGLDRLLHDATGEAS